MAGSTGFCGEGLYTGRVASRAGEISLGVILRMAHQAESSVLFVVKGNSIQGGGPPVVRGMALVTSGWENA